MRCFSDSDPADRSLGYVGVYYWYDGGGSFETGVSVSNCENLPGIHIVQMKLLPRIDWKRSLPMNSRKISFMIIRIQTNEMTFIGNALFYNY